MLHERCIEAKRLLDAYVIALTNDDSARIAKQIGDITAREAREVQDYLLDARNRYWTHVNRHRCRKAE